MFFLGSGTALLGIGDNFSTLLLLRAITGLGAGMLQPNVFAYIGDRYSYEQRGSVMGVIMAALTSSTIFGVPLGSYLAEMSSWRWTYLTIGLLAMVMVVSIYIVIPNDKTCKEASSSSSIFLIHQLSSNGSVFFALLSTFLWYGGLQGMMANLGFYYSQKFNLNVGQIGMVLMSAGLGSVIGSILGGKLADKFGKKIIIGVGSFFSALGVLLISTISHNVIAAIFVHVIWSTAFGFGHSALTALISELTPSIRGTVLSLNSSAMYAGMMSATATSSVLLQSANFLQVGIICAIATLFVFPITNFLVNENSKSL